jgi:hypothetical protein
MELLNPEWISHVFDPRFVGLVKQRPREWIPVPLGDPTLESAPIIIQMRVPISYRQGTQSTCLANSLASALVYLQQGHAGQEVFRLAKNLEHLPQPDALSELCSHLASIGRQRGNCKWFNRKVKKKTTRHLDLSEVLRGFNCPVIVTPVGSDGSQTHAVCVVDDLIFDSTQERALKLERESFDWIVGEGVACVGIGISLMVWPDRWQRRKQKSNW